VTVLRAAATGARTDLGQGWTLALGADRVHLLRPGAEASPAPLELAGAAGQSAWDGWRVRWGIEAAPGVHPRDGATAWFIPGRLVIRSWRAGDRIRPIRGTGSRLAVRCFQDARVARHDRSRWPLLDSSEGLAWIAGVCRAELALPPAGSAAVRVDVARA
jgi:tRNA(Ile)-lysidine synthetase-like protein